MQDAEEQNWLDDAFDESKAAAEIENAKRSNRLVLILVIVLIVLLVACGFSCVGMFGALSALS